ncbi:Structural maintenance of chromosomes protein 2-1 [Nymphaea thermarum]|nr:Structural maintenance of chromosomes protein 2-1 [Nymphaea thermarum]
MQTAEMVRRIGEELDEANKNAKEKRTLHEACLSQVSSLERSIKDHGHENEKQRLIMEKDAMIQERAALESQLNSVEAQIKAFEEEISKLEDKVRSIKQEYHSAKSELDFGHSKIKECDAQINSLTKKQQKLQQKLSDANVDKKKIENEMRRMETQKADCTAKVDKLLERHSWIRSERHLFGKSGTDYDFSAHNPHKSREAFEKLQAEQSSLEKRVNKKVMAMFEKAEDEYKGLISKKAIIENDKSKIKKVIEELDEKKKETLKILGQFFLLYYRVQWQSWSLQKDAVSWMDWKCELRLEVCGSSLTGGQRSLLALSLILALLLFKPAPLYILDELLYTINPSALQFIVVSLKEGMFSNANVIFRTKFVDGVSTVQWSHQTQGKVLPTNLPGK